MKKENSALRSELLPGLKSEVRSNGHITRNTMAGLAESAGVQLNEAYGVATFYSYLPLSPAAKNVVRVCKCLPCAIKDVPSIMAALQKELGVGPGKVTSDGKFLFEMVNCIGACDQAPAMMVNDTLYGNLTPARVAEILKSY